MSVGRARVFTYTVCGALSGLSGVVLSSQLKSGAPTQKVVLGLVILGAVLLDQAKKRLWNFARWLQRR